MDKVNDFNDTFFMVLSSNDSLNFHPQNNSSNFTYQFEKPLEFFKEMEVGLVDISLPLNYNFINVPKSKINIMIKNWNKTSFLYSLNVEEKYVANILELFDYIKSILKNYDQKLMQKEIKRYFLVENKEKYDAFVFLYFRLPKIRLTKNKFEFSSGLFTGNLRYREDQKYSTPSYEIYYEFDNNLNKIINLTKLPDNPMIPNIWDQISSKDIALENIHNFIICSDIIKSSIHGSSHDSVLRLIDKSKVKINETIIFNPILFVPVKKHKFDSISIYIKDDYNRCINFVNNNETSLVLLFRPLEHI